jgi:hypothetical protein
MSELQKAAAWLKLAPAMVKEQQPQIILYALQSLQVHLEEEQQAKETPSQAQPQSATSSAPTTGPAMKLSELSTARLRLMDMLLLDALPERAVEGILRLTQEIMGFSRSTQSTPDEWEMTSPDSSTLQLTLRSHTPSGSTRDGDRGVADHE